MIPTANEVWRDYVTDGVPASGLNSPAKSDARAWGSFVEAISGGGGPGLGYATKALLDADLAHAANSLAIVYSDSTAASNGLYQKAGASGAGSWARIADLPNGIVRLTVTGGTANAIVASAPETPTVPGAKLYLLTPTAQNTAATTITVNGGSAVAIKNAFGSTLASGSLMANSQVLMAWAVDHYQLLISANVDASAILADAQAADVSANSAASDAATSATTAAATAATVAGTIGGIIAQTYTEAAAATIPTDVDAVTVMGYTDPGDGPAAPYVSRLSEPSHTGKFLSNGVWRELERHDGVYLEDFGGKQSVTADFSYDSTLDSVTAFADCIDYCVAKHRNLIRFNSGLWIFKSAPPVIPVGLLLAGHGHSSSVYHGGTTLWAYYNEAVGNAPFLHWDGSGTASNSTGGGAHEMTIAKGPDFTGGCLVKLTGVNDGNRPGYMSFRDLNISGTQGAASCNYCIIHDGSNLVTSGTQGIRDVTWDTIWLDGASTEAAQFINATHAKISNMQVSAGGGAATPIVRITGDTNNALHKTTDLQASNLSVTGNLIMQNADHCIVHGAASILTIDMTNLTNSMFTGIWDAIKNTSGTVLSTTDIDNLRSGNNVTILGRGTAF